MSIAPEVERFLRESGVRYEVLRHAEAFTAQEEAAAAQVSGYEWAKTVVFFTESGHAIMAVVPAPFRVDRRRLEQVVRGGELRLADEDDFRHLYGRCEVGSMPPLGPLYDQAVYVDERLAQDEQIVFNAGDHVHAIRMSYADFDRVVEPVVGRFAARATSAAGSTEG